MILFLFRLIFVVVLGNIMEAVVKVFITGEKFYRKYVLHQEVPEDI